MSVPIQECETASTYSGILPLSSREPYSLSIQLI